VKVVGSGEVRLGAFGAAGAGHWGESPFGSRGCAGGWRGSFTLTGGRSDLSRELLVARSASWPRWRGVCESASQRGGDGGARWTEKLLGDGVCPTKVTAKARSSSKFYVRWIDAVICWR
jgi:hypothetical protein